jgi:hypothetical protein
MSNKRPASSSPSHDDDPPVYTSPAIVDRSSTFIGHYSPTLTAKEVSQLPDLESASHKIAAWRFPSAQRTIQPGAKTLYETGHDDDGEKNGGRTIEKLLESMQVTGSVVVARWYGGVMLGPVRFQHMETAGRNAIKAWRDEEASKKRKIDDAKRQQDEDAEDIVRLPSVLQERDRSIIVLRGLLAEKTGKSKAEVGAVSPSRKMDYTGMPLQSLRKLEAARDRTIAFLLKQIDTEEIKIKKMEEDERARKWLERGGKGGSVGRPEDHGIDVQAEERKTPSARASVTEESVTQSQTTATNATRTTSKPTHNETELKSIIDTTTTAEPPPDSSSTSMPALPLP